MAKNNCEVYKYTKFVTTGKIPACKTIIKACERHLRDLETAGERGLYFDCDAAEHAINFFPFLKHSKGEWAGRPLDLELWQKFTTGSIFGWKRKEDGFRRFRTAYEEVPRKNGKSTKLSGTGLYLLIGDDEPGAEVYSAATKRDQARITHGEAIRMVKKSPVLFKRIKIYKDNLNIENTASKFEPLGADADTMDGLNIHGALIDELHAHKTRRVWDVLETGTGSRRQPLLYAITTAGFDQSSICWEIHNYAMNILDNTIQDDTFFAYIACLDDETKWDDPVEWQKANPNYGISVKEDDLKRLCEKAKKIPAAQNNFLCKRLNVWTQQADRWIGLNLWDENNISPVIESALRGKTCFGGLDLSTVSDLTCWTLAFPREDDPEILDFLYRIWCPKDKIYDRENRYRDQYQVWEKNGLLEVIPGNAIDFRIVESQILEDAKTFKLVDLNIDRLFQGHQVGVDLEEQKIKVFPMGMGSVSFAAPMVEFERRLLTHKINHGGHPIARFAINNMAVIIDKGGNKKPDKASSQGKIDPVVTMVMALDRAMRHVKKKSIYETRGVITM